MLSDAVKDYVDRCVLCWLATMNDKQPSVSPKEIFTYHGDDTIIIANIASPQSVRNINQYDRVCVSFVDIFSQKGFQLYGSATLLNADSELCNKKHHTLQQIAGPMFQVRSVINITIDRVKRIIAPSYRIKKAVTEQQMIDDALTTYGVLPIRK